MGDEISDVDDAILEDMAHCDWCGAPCDVSDITLFGSVALCDDCGDQDSSGLLVTVVRLRTALAWYADPNTYLASWPEPHDQSTFEEAAIERDRGEIARTALAPQSDQAS